MTKEGKGSNNMIRFKVYEKFEGANEGGLTYEQFIQKDVRDFIASYPRLIEADLLNNNDPQMIQPAPSSNARYALSNYYYKYLDNIFSLEQANILKSEIIQCVSSETELFQL